MAAHGAGIITIALAGRAANRRGGGLTLREIGEAARGDLMDVEAELELLDPAERGRALFAANRRAIETVDEHWLVICRVAAELDERGAISGIMLDQVMAEARDEWATISAIEQGINARDYVGRMTRLSASSAR